MKTSAKRMLLMRSNQNNGQNAENRFRDDRGREHYDNGVMLLCALNIRRIFGHEAGVTMKDRMKDPTERSKNQWE